MTDEQESEHTETAATDDSRHTTDETADSIDETADSTDETTGSTDETTDSIDATTGSKDETSDSSAESGASSPESAIRSGGETGSDGDPSDEQDLTTRKRRLEERELGLDSRAEDLDRREQTLNQRKRELDERQDDLAERRRNLEDWEATLEQRTDELDEREAELDEFEEELSETAAVLDEHEDTLHRYIGEQVDDLDDRIQASMQSALEQYEKERVPGRFGSTGSVLAGVAGLALVAAGVGYGSAVQFDAAAGLFVTRSGNLAVAAGLLVFGVALTIGTLADRL